MYKDDISLLDYIWRNLHYLQVYVAEGLENDEYNELEPQIYFQEGTQNQHDLEDEHEETEFEIEW